MNKTLRNIILAIGIMLLFQTSLIYADPLWGFSTLPGGGDISGPAGATIGWGYELTNLDPNNWLAPYSLAADSFQFGNPESVFDFPILGPGSAWTVPFDGSMGLLKLTWDTAAPTGFSNSGVFALYAEWYDADPLGGGNWLDDAGVMEASYSATVTGSPIPEPATLVSLLSGIVAILAVRHRLFICGRRSRGRVCGGG